jgi:hypothetical protein
MSHNVSVSDRDCGGRCCICLIMFLFLTGTVEGGFAYVSECHNEMLTPQVLHFFVCKVPKNVNCCTRRLRQLQGVNLNFGFHTGHKEILRFRLMSPTDDSLFSVADHESIWSC